MKTTATIAAFKQLPVPVSHSSLQAPTSTTASVFFRNVRQKTSRCLSSNLNELPRLEDTIKKVLIANRGEIACRIIRTCRALQIPTVAIYSSADGAQSLHATMADESHPIGCGPSSSESYLRSDEIIDIARRTNSSAIHPGFGFLSERASFAKQVTSSSNMIFVGPPVQAMEDMASKSRAKQMMDRAGVPTTPGYDPYNRSTGSGEVTDEATMDEQLYEHAIHHVGFPLLIKALMGGGGKGMRLVHTSSDFKENLRSCQNEASQSFGDSRVLLERYLIHPRHIEVQVIGDKYDNIVHLYERDCSVQRRHQKVLEEAPASDFSSNFRNYIGQLGVQAASAVNYVNAGTVEFLLDTNAQSSPGLLKKQTDTEGDEQYPNIYFCEMNTRLQVEHSVTEQITGIDIVEWQLRVAAGEVLPIPKQENIPSINGHSIEARIYAETPTKNFLPSPGHVWYHSPPLTTTPNGGTNPTTGIRVDTGIQRGQNVSVYYDPMIAKLICHGSNRSDAIQKLQNALQNYHIAGVSNNIDFLLHCVQHPTFHNAEMINTGFIEDYGDSIIQDCIDQESKRKSHPMARLAGAMAVLFQIEDRIVTNSKGPWSSHSGSWRIGGEAARVQRKLHIMPDHQAISCTSNRDGSFDINWSDVDETSFHVDGRLQRDGNMELRVNHTQHLKMTTVIKREKGIFHLRMWPVVGKRHKNDYYWETDILDPMLSDINSETIIAETTGDGVVFTPMPGKVSRINFQVGDAVSCGDVIVVMEAMKMEHPCISPCNGTIAEIRVVPSMVVPDSAVLFVVTERQTK